jgi:Uma2 family endonuclease
MMVIQTIQATVEAFDEFVGRPENSDKLFEFIGGEIVEVVSNPYASKLGARMGGLLSNYLDEHDLGHLTGADGGYTVAGERYIPDAAFISYQKHPGELSYHDRYLPFAPDLAIEVLSPGNREDEITIKVANYLAAGTLVWLLKPEPQQIVVFAPGQPARILNSGDTLDGGALLPGFQVALAHLFRKTGSDQTVEPVE